MPRAHEQAGKWFKAVRERQRLDEGTVRARSRRQKVLIGMSYVLVFVAVWSVLAIYGPVVKVEAEYTLRHLGATKTGKQWWERMVPDFTLALTPDVVTSEWGIVIPKIYLQEKVVANVNPTSKASYLPALNIGIAHAAGTELPGMGGLGYYFAHSSGMNVLYPQKQAVFYLLGKLGAGDEIDVYHFGEKYAYQVTESKIVAANDVSFLDNQGDEERIVLQTCWPIGTSAKRLLVFAQRV